MKLFFLLLFLIDSSKCACPKIWSRTEWNALSPKSSRNLKINPPKYVVVHHTATPECNSFETCKNRVRNIQNSHMNDNNWEDIGYNFLIGTEGSIFEGRGWGKHGAHVPSYNAKSIGISLIGNFQGKYPPQLQVDALKNLINCGIENKKIQEKVHVIGHRQGGATLCPGDKLQEIIKKWDTFDSNPN